VTLLALNPRLSPGTHDTWQFVLVRTLWPVGIPGGVAGPTIVWYVLVTGVIGHPLWIIMARDRVGKVVLAGVFRISRLARRIGDDITFLVHKAGFPIVAADDVANVIPGVTLWRLRDLGKGVVWGLAVHHLIQLPGVAGL
jgi:hypothetical protein